MVAALVHPLFDCNPPTMNRFHDIDGHISEPIQIQEKIIDHFNGAFDSFIDLYGGIAMFASVFDINIVILVTFFDICFLEDCEYSFHFDHISFDFFQSSFS